MQYYLAQRFNRFIEVRRHGQDEWCNMPTRHKQRSRSLQIKLFAVRETGRAGHDIEIIIDMLDVVCAPVNRIYRLNRRRVGDSKEIAAVNAGRKTSFFIVTSGIRLENIVKPFAVCSCGDMLIPAGNSRVQLLAELVQSIQVQIHDHSGRTRNEV